MSTLAVCGYQQTLYGRAMNIGGRIVQRLSQLGWERKDLLDKIPDLTAQALSALITRDSVRSEWDTRIADALGVSVLWLVYDIDGETAVPENVISPAERGLIDGFRFSDQTARATMLWLAERALAKKQKSTANDLSTGDPAVTGIIDHTLKNVARMPEGQPMPLLTKSIDKNHEQQRSAQKASDGHAQQRSRKTGGKGA